VFYTSGAPPSYPAVVDTTLFDDNSTVWNVMIGTGSGSKTAPSGGAPAESPAPSAQSAGPVGVSWTGNTNVHHR
jgi:hypothetical protein